VAVSHTLSMQDLEHKVLVKVPVDEAVEYIYEQLHDDDKSFTDHIQHLAREYENDDKIPPSVGSQCKKCEFICNAEQEAEGFKNGFKECWRQAYKWQDKDFEEAHMFELWNFRGVQKLIDTDKVKLADLTEDDVKPKDDGKPGLSNSQRQWLQVEMCRDGETEAYLDVQGIKAEMASWTYPLHFIDFETTTVALPFTQGRRPYEGIAFQFSHHVVRQDDSIAHVGEYLNTERGVFPNIDFVRALKAELEQDKGTIFRYADHENNFLNLIAKQIKADADSIEDADELLTFIQSITHSTGGVKPPWTGERDMVDLLKLVKRYYYHPDMKGSNSLKQVLPAVLSGSKFLQKKYSQPIYGEGCKIPSLHFKDHIWIKMEEGRVVDPYKQLPSLFKGVSEKNVALLSEEDELSNGGAAMTAYTKIQFEDMSEYEREELEQGLLKYCELDTLAMVMVYEAWKDMI